MATPPAPKRVGKAQPTPNQPREKAAPTSKGRKDVTTKIFVLDTCVLLFYHSALTNFEDNKVAIPITVLEELDRFKKGNEDINFQARQFLRTLDELTGDVISGQGAELGEGLGRIRVVLGTELKDSRVLASMMASG